MAGSGDDDTKPDPLFKNVPRRPRTAASCPRKEDSDGGGDPPGPGGISSVSNNASPPPPATTSVASNKKRPASSTAGGAAEHVARAKKKQRLVVPIEEPEPEPENARDRRGVGILAGVPPALSHKDKAAAAAAALASSASRSEAELAAVDWAAENERWLRKGKTPVVNEDDDEARAAVARRAPAGPPGHGGKLLGDAIRSHGSTVIAGTGSFKPPSRTTTKPKKPQTKPKKPPKKDRTRTKPKKKKEKAAKKDSGPWFWCVSVKGVDDGMSPAGADADHSFDRLAVVSDALRATLRGLGVAVAPVRLYGRLLTRCDRDVQQSRLLMSCKRWRGEGAEFPVCAFLTEGEKAAAHGLGLPVTAYDRGGAAYELTFRFLECNFAYRLISKWSDFLKGNGLDVGKGEPLPAGDDVMVDLWLFRLPAGEVGMVVLHYRRGDAAHADAVLDEIEQKRIELKNGAAAVEAAVMEGDEDGGVMGEAAAAAPAPSSPSEPSGGGATEVALAEYQAGGSGKVPDAPSTSSELQGGTAGRSDEVTAAPLLSLGGGGDGAEEEEEQGAGGGAVMVMVLEVEAAATQPSLNDSNAGGAANGVGESPSSPEAAAGGGGAAMVAMVTEDEDELDEAAARLWNVTKYEFQAAQGLLMLSEATNSDG